MSNRNSLTRLTLTYTLIAALILGALVAEMACYARNTPANHPAWVSGKQLLRTSIMGSGEGFTRRNIFCRNQLNLGEWHGFNEYLLNNVWPFHSLSASFCIEDNAYLYVMFNRTAESFRAVRLSRNPALPSALVRATPSGQFLDRQPLNDLEIEPGWHKVLLESVSDGIELRIDGRLQCQITVAPLSEQVIGFRSGLQPAFVDDVVALDPSNSVVINEDFRNDDRWLSQTAACALGIFALTWTLLGLAFWIGISAKKRLFATVLASALMTAVVSGLLGFDYFYWSSRYPYEVFTPWQRGDLEANGVERLRCTMFDAFGAFDADDASLPEHEHLDGRYQRICQFLAVSRREDSGEDVIAIQFGPDGYSPARVRPTADAVREYVARNPGAYRVLWFGTSQAWGAGATHEHDRMAVRMHEILLQKTEGKMRLHTFNCSVRGSTPAKLLQRHRDITHFIEPNLMVVDLSNNGPQESFADELRSIVDLARQDGVNVLFVLEPNTSELGSGALIQKHATMRLVAEQTDTPVCDMHSYFGEMARADGGILWWDQVHMTSYGQKLAAEFIAAEMIERFGVPVVK